MATATESAAAEAPQPSVNMAAFEFVTALTGALNKGAIELPAFPDIAIKVKRVLEDENTTTNTIARVISSEPGLASRVLKMANSAANSRGTAITDVPRAVGRLGQTAIRTLATSYAMQNMMDGRAIRQLRPYLNDLWNHSVHVSAIARALAATCAGIDRDEAMFVGLIHDVGKLYILTRIEDFPELFDSEESIASLMTDWNVAIGQAILESWEFDQRLIDAVAQHEDLERPPGPVELTDVLCAANILCQQLESESIEEFDFAASEPLARVGVTAERYAKIMEDSREEIEAMMTALNG